MKNLEKIISHFIAKEAKIDHRAIVNVALDNEGGLDKLPGGDKFFFLLPPIKIKDAKDLERLNENLMKLIESV